MPEFVTVETFAALERRVAALEGVEPQPDPQPDPEPGPSTYTVQPGDTLSRVAALHFVTVADLVAWNDIPDPDRIRVGDVLAVTAPADEPPPAPQPEPSPEPEPEPGPAVLTNLTATIDDTYVVLDWDGPDTIHLTAEDLDADGELLGETDQGVVTGSPQRRGPMGRRNGSGYRFSGRPVYDDGTEGEVQVFPLATFPVESAPTPDPAPQPTPTPTPRPDPGPGGGTVLWSDAPADPVGSTHPFTNWENAAWNIYGGCTVKVVSDPVKGKAIRSFAPAGGDRGGSQRGELVPELDKIRDGTELWLGFDLLIPEANGLARSHQQVMQLKSYPSESYAVFSINCNNHREGLVVDNNGDYLGPTPYTEWTRMVVGLHVSQSEPWREIWRDGVNVLPRERSSNMRRGDRSCYLKLLNYRDGGIPFDVDMRIARVAIGTTRASVE